MNAPQILTCLALFVSYSTLALGKEIVVPSALLTICESVEVPAAEAGLLVELKQREGGLVKRADVLGRTENRAARLQLEQAQRDLDMAQQEFKNDAHIRLAKKQHELAKVELQRSTDINTSYPGTVSARELERLKLTVESTALEIEQALFEQSQSALKIRRIESDVQMAQHNIDMRNFRSPIDGMIVHVEKHAGEWAKQGDVIVRIVRVDRLRAEGFITAPQALQSLVGRSADVRVKVGDEAEVRIAGRVVFVSPEVQPVASQARFWVEFDNSEMKLRPGLTCEVTIGDGPLQASLSTSTAAK